MFEVDGDENYVDIVGKHCVCQHACPLVKPLLFWLGIQNIDDKNESCTNRVSQLKTRLIDENFVLYSVHVLVRRLLIIERFVILRLAILINNRS